MSNPHSPRSHSPSRTATGRPMFEQRRGWAGHPSPKLIADGVVAGYIHDISARHGNGATEGWRRRRRGDRS